jgi:HPt (histidine-containing phosphotransfer) domain-containing protein
VNNTEILDPAALASLEEMASGDRQFIAELIDTWVSDAARQIAAIEQALVTGDADTLRRAAHTLKSTSQSLGAIQLAGRCAEIEAHARDGRMQAVSALLQTLHDCHEQARAALLAMRPAS